MTKVNCADRFAAEKQARKHYQTAYDYEIDLQIAFAAHREAVVEVCARIASEGCLVPPDGGSPTEEEYLLCERIKSKILALNATA